MKKSLLIALIIAGSAFSQISIRIGPPPAPRVVRVHPAAPGPGYTWVDGYWYPVNNKYVWHNGYWTRPPYEGAHWVAPHHDGQVYLNGFWDGDHGRFEHDHQWDRDHDRDFRGDRR